MAQKGENQDQLNQFASELEQEIKRAPRGAPGDSIIANVQTLIAALRAGDYLAAVRAIRDVLNHLLGDGTDGTPRAMQADAINWKGLLGILLKILPLLLSEQP